jgi:hypothetical protein
MQATAYEAAGPLISLLKDLEEERDQDVSQTVEAVKLSLALLGNCFARFSQERKRKILLAINSQLDHLADEEFELSDTLFGEGAVDRIQKRVDTLKTLQKAKQPFRQSGMQGKGRPTYRGKQGPSRPSFSRTQAPPP